MSAVHHHGFERFVSAKFLDTITYVECVMAAFFMAVMIWALAVDFHRFIPLVIFFGHYVALEKAFLILEHLEKTKESSVHRAFRVKILRLRNWIFSIAVVLLTDVGSLIYEILEGSRGNMALHVCTIVLWSWGTLSALIYLIFSASFHAIDSGKPSV